LPFPWFDFFENLNFSFQITLIWLNGGADFAQCFVDFAQLFIFIFGDNNYGPIFKMTFNTLYRKFVAFSFHPIPCVFDRVLMLIRYLIKPSLWV